MNNAATKTDTFIYQLNVRTSAPGDERCVVTRHCLETGVAYRTTEGRGCTQREAVREAVRSVRRVRRLGAL
jgi:hypothetical protein